MKHSILLFIVFLILTSCSTSSIEQEGFSEQDIASIKDFFKTHDEFVLSADWSSQALQYTEDAIRFPPGGDPVEGRKNIEEGFGVIDRYTNFKADLFEIDGQGDLAYVMAKFSAKFILVGSPDEYDMSGISMAILKRDVNDKWHLHRVIWN